MVQPCSYIKEIVVRGNHVGHIHQDVGDTTVAGTQILKFCLLSFVLEFLQNGNSLPSYARQQHAIPNPELP